MIDIERVRFSGELEAYEMLERKDRGEMLRFNLQKPNPEGDRRTLLSRAVLLTDSMAPELYAVARQAMSALGVDDEIELFQRAGIAANARLVLYGKPIAIEFIGDYVEHFEAPSLVAIVGHEVGHAIAHSGHAKYRWALPACQDGKTPWRRAFAMAAEVTADRFGLLACRDLHAALRLEMQSATGRVSSKIHYDTDAYLEQCKHVAEETAKHGTRPASSTHPDHYLRGYAEWLFWESDVFHELTGGLGPNTRKLADVDKQLRPLMGLPIREKEEKAPRPKSEEGRPSPVTIVADRARETLDAVTGFARRIKGPIAPATTELATSFQEHVKRARKK